jgi:erythronate-4-phosphate dehydrogenase
MKIVADSQIPLVEEAFSAFGPVELVHSRDITKEVIKGAELLLVRSVTKVDQKLIEGTHVRFAATATAGADHVDREWLNSQHIGFASAPGCNALAVAEYVAAALLVLSQKRNVSLHGKKIGIVGVGNVGSRVHTLARVLGMECLLCDPPLQRKTGVSHFRSFPQLLHEADIVTLHVPLTIKGEDATYHLLNDETLQQMKTGAWLINSSRGEVCDEPSLRKHRSRLQGLALDVWAHEPAINPAMVAAADIATPHIAGYSAQGKMRATWMIYQAACAFFYKTATWAPTQAEQEAKRIEIKNSADPVFAAVMQACPLLRDDTALRAAVTNDKKDIGGNFESLRGKYRHRQEFANYHVIGASDQDAIRLRELGFAVE